MGETVPNIYPVSSRSSSSVSLLSTHLHNNKMTGIVPMAHSPSPPTSQSQPSHGLTLATQPGSPHLTDPLGIPVMAHTVADSGLFINPEVLRTSKLRCRR